MSVLRIPILFLKMPKLIVLDLDWTTWVGDCGKDFVGPYTGTGDLLFDAYGTPVRLYPDVRAILTEFAAAGVKIAFASRNPATARCEEALRAFGLFDMACVFLAHPSDGTHTKRAHFATIHARTGIAYSDMLFFDDGPRNIEGARAMGIPSLQCRYPNGLTWAHVYVLSGLLNMDADVEKVDVGGAW